MPVVVTLTLNPALDVSTSTPRVEPDRKLRCTAGRRDPGGGGINVARVAHRLGARTLAIFPSGGLTGQMLERLVEAEGVGSLPVPVSGETREDVTVLDESSGAQYRFIMPGPHLHGVEWMACLKALAGLEAKPDFVCASGSLPPGVAPQRLRDLAQRAKARDLRLAVDCSSEALAAALGAGVHLVKPNLRELSDLVGRPLPGLEARLGACRELIAGGGAAIVALSLGAEGALLVTSTEAWAAPGLPIRPVSTVGAGDSFLGGLLWALDQQLGLAAGLRYATAAGSAALLSPGTELCRPEDVLRLADQVTVAAIGAGR